MSTSNKLYSNLKIFHYPDKLNSLEGETHRPVHVRIKPTNICNHHCSYCAYRSGLQLGKDMNDKDFIPKERMMDLILELHGWDIKAVTFSGGGEPFCYPYLVNALRRLSQTNIKFAALTNGSRLDGEEAEIFAYCGTWLRISMDGWDDDSYEHYRGVRDYTKIMKNMENFKKIKGGCYLGVSLIIDRYNYTHIYEAVSRLKDVGVDSVKMSPCIVSNDMVENNHYHAKILTQVNNEIHKCKLLLGGDDFEIFDSYHLEDKFEKDYTWCPYLQILPVIGADLNVYPCQDKAYNNEAILGSIKDQSFSDFWYNGKEKFFKINPSRDCNHHCVANNKNKMIHEFLNLDHVEFV